MDDVDLKIAAMEKELAELKIRIHALGERLGHGENDVRADLNPAIRRERELSSQLHDLKVSAGRLAPGDSVQVMYGPPWNFSTRNDSPAAPMDRPRPLGFQQRSAQQDEAGRKPDDIAKLPGIWRRLFGRK